MKKKDCLLEARNVRSKKMTLKCTMKLGEQTFKQFNLKKIEEIYSEVSNG